MSKIVIAVLCSDLHFCHTPPAARASEPDWYEAMGRAWSQVVALARDYIAPIIVAGDLFDRWNSPPETINWAIRQFKQVGVWAIPGQHDLPNHEYEAMSRSAYGVLVEAGAIRNLEPGKSDHVGRGLVARGFPWGFEVQPNRHPPDQIRLAVVHAYVWAKGYSYFHAPEIGHISVFAEKLRGFHAAVFGDNHKGFLTLAGSTNVLNCGGLMRRSSDEMDRVPMVGLLKSDGEIETVQLDVSEDKWTEEAVRSFEQVERRRDEKVAEFLDGLKDLGSESLDYKSAVRQAAASAEAAVRERLLRSIGG